jgi:threonine dehydrogenase-like Zn-dependent dehydrogenase
MDALPRVQRAVELVGPGELRLNAEKPVHPPGPHQVLCRVEAVGLCFSDLKLVKQFADHPRKSEVVGGIDGQVLEEIPSYVPGERPTVPGHEAVVRVCAAGNEVTAGQTGERYLVQTDYRWLPTADANAAFGYNFEGALQEYVLMDERAITSPEGEGMLIPASEKLSASAIALVEPWACVEAAYSVQERQRLTEGGRLLVVTDVELPTGGVSSLVPRLGRPSEVLWTGSASEPPLPGIATSRVSSLSEVSEASCDDLVYFGHNEETVEKLFPLLAPRGLLNIVLCGGRFLRHVAVAVGRVHYGGIRLVGTEGSDPAASMATVPSSGEIREGARVHVVGAGGPMGAMHVIRALSSPVPGLDIVASDIDRDRLSTLTRIAAPLAAANGHSFCACNVNEEAPQGTFDYLAIMVPSPDLVAEAIEQAALGAVINVFAGIPADVSAKLDLNEYIEKRCYLIGTSGSALEDMKTVLAKVETGVLDTNLSVAAVGGLEAAISGLRAIEERQIAGKVVIYPSCRGLGLTSLDELGAYLPEAAPLLRDGVWSQEAERALLGRHGA